MFSLTESHTQKQTFGISIHNKKLDPDSFKLSQIEQITVTWQQSKPAVTAAEQLEHQGKTPSLFDSPPLSLHRVRHTVHVVDMSSEASAGSLKAVSELHIRRRHEKKDATKEPVAMGPEMPRAHTHERAMKLDPAHGSTFSHLHSEF